MGEIFLGKFSERLAKRLSERQLRPAQLAKQAGVDKGYLSTLLSGEKSNPGEEIVERLAKALDVSKGWLATGEGQPHVYISHSSSDSSVVQELPDLERTIELTIRAGPAAAARGMSDAELIERLQEHAGKLSEDHTYMRPAHAEIIVALAAELRSRPIYTTST